MSDAHDCPICGESFDSKHGMRIHRGYEHDLPYKDEEIMRRLYVEEQLSIPEIAEMVDAGETTIEAWLDRHGIDTRDRGGKPDDAAYKDTERLRELYCEQRLSRSEIADRLGCTEGDVRYQIEKHGIEKTKPWRDPELLRERCEEENIPVKELAERWNCGESTIYQSLEEFGIERPWFARERAGKSVPYRMIWHEENGQKYAVFVHRLVACAHGMIDPSEVYSGETDIHHKNGIVIDNAPENLRSVTPEEHQQIHSESSAYSSSDR